MDRELIIIINYMRGVLIEVDVIKFSERWLKEILFLKKKIEGA
jgi:hypothetical protein